MKKTIINVVLFAVFAYLASTAMAWKVRNQLGNDMTYWVYFPAPLTFERIPALQAQP